MARILAIGDPHFRSDNAEQTSELGLSIQRIITRSTNLDAVVVLGDILHRHDKVDLHPLHRAVEFLSLIRSALDELDESHPKASSRVMVVLIGNHDRPNNTTFLTDEHPFTAVKLWRSCIIVDEPTFVVIKNMRFLMMPYVPIGRFMEALNLAISRQGEYEYHGFDDHDYKTWYRDREIKAVFAHQEFRGCTLSEGIESKIGDLYDKDAPFCISGHIHHRNKPQRNILYIGTPIVHTYTGGIGTVSMFLFTKGDEPNEEIIELVTIPQNVTVTMNFKDLKKRIKANHGNGSLKEIFTRGTNVRLKIGILCHSVEEYKATVTESRTYRDLVKEGIKVHHVIDSKNPKDSENSEDAKDCKDSEMRPEIQKPTSFKARLKSRLEDIEDKDVKSMIRKMISDT